jgi:hypothetical protein
MTVTREGNYPVARSPGLDLSWVLVLVLKALALLLATTGGMESCAFLRANMGVTGGDWGIPV